MERCFLDISDISGTDLYCSREAAEEIRRRIAPQPLNALHVLGNGNYHYLSLFYLERINEPFTLVLFDHHSDNQPGAFGGELLSCGSWVLEATKRLDNLKKVVWIGGDGQINDIPESLPAYLSIDLDILAPEYVKTVWDQGDMELSELMLLINYTMKKCDMIGIDLCGAADNNDPTVLSICDTICSL